MPQTNIGIQKHQLQLAPRRHNVLEMRRILPDLLVSKWRRRAEYDSPLCSRQGFNRIIDVTQQQKIFIINVVSVLKSTRKYRRLRFGLKIPIVASIKFDGKAFVWKSIVVQESVNKIDKEQRFAYPRNSGEKGYAIIHQATKRQVQKSRIEFVIAVPHKNMLWNIAIIVPKEPRQLVDDKMLTWNVLYNYVFQVESEVFFLRKASYEI